MRETEEEAGGRRCHTRAGSFLATSPTRAPGRQQTALWDGPSVPFIRESPVTITLLFFLTSKPCVNFSE